MAIPIKGPPDEDMSDSPPEMYHAMSDPIPIPSAPYTPSFNQGEPSPGSPPSSVFSLANFHAYFDWESEDSHSLVDDSDDDSSTLSISSTMKAMYEMGSDTDDDELHDIEDDSDSNDSRDDEEDEEENGNDDDHCCTCNLASAFLKYALEQHSPKGTGPPPP